METFQLYFLLVTLLLLHCVYKSLGQSIGYGMPNFGLMYNPYTSPAWGYGLGPQFSTIRGSLASGMLFGGHPGIASLGGFGTGPLPFGPYSSFAFPGMSSGYNTYGPFGRYPGSTGTLGYGSYQGYNVYTGMGSYPGIGAFNAFAPGDFNHYRNDPARQNNLASLGLNPNGGGGVIPMASSSSPSSSSASSSRDNTFGSTLGQTRQSSQQQLTESMSQVNSPPFVPVFGQQGFKGSNGVDGSFMSIPSPYFTFSSNNYPSDSLNSILTIGGRKDSRNLMMSDEESSPLGIRESTKSPQITA